MAASAGVMEAVEGEVPRAASKPAKSRRTTFVMAGLGVVAAAGVTSWFVLHRGLETTDDAQVDADMVSVPSRAAGVVVKVAFTENQQVKAGDLLAELDATPAKARLAQADAALEAARASADAADADARVA